MGTGSSFLGLKRPACEANHLSPASLRMSGAMSPPPYTFVSPTGQLLSLKGRGFLVPCVKDAQNSLRSRCFVGSAVRPVPAVLVVRWLKE